MSERIPDGEGASESSGWVEDLAALVGDEAARSFALRSGASYREQTPPARAALDVEILEGLPAPGSDAGTAGAPGSVFGTCHRLVVGPDPTPGAGPGAFRLRRYGRDGVELSRLLPVVESFGLVVVEAVPHPIGPGGDHAAAHIDDIGLRRPNGRAPTGGAGDPTADRLVAALEAVDRGLIDVDSLNRLVLGANLDWHEVNLLRAYRRYRRQTGVVLSDAQLDDPLVAFPAVTRALIDHVAALLGPDRGPAGDAASSRADMSRADMSRSGMSRHAVLEALGAVGHLEQDQVLRAYLALVDATVRTNWFLRQPDGRPRPTVVIKLDSARVPGLTPPLPRIETWVHGPDVEGIHLRNGLIARGGIRWSDRPEDFRTEVLGLAEAQVKKNAIIVPTGAKGGFVVRRAGPGGPGPAQVEAAYRRFIDSLFDVTDNVVDGAVVHPDGVAALDGDDPYLVVAADRGTATFSDLANGISAAHGFWLGDAFASGGSHGYDHKAMGITARGAWVAVRRHFHQLGIDVATEPVRVVGVGDMSGDVFGNGMLRSEAITLVAAFDHRHIFIDPAPDPAVSFTERTRMAALPRSSWDDYDRAAMSPGGGVWPRDAKVIELSAEARRALGVAAERLSPPEVISAILSAPADLLFFGGIGTYIKGPGEADAEVGDHANDGVRVVADQVRARVIAEGGNLAITQRGRIRYSRRGGRINADFIDNAAGVATSDREVNLKILLTQAIGAGRLEPEERDAVLAGATDQVAAEVLRQVDHSVAALNRAVPVSADELDAHEALLGHLEEVGRLDRAVECLPDPAEFALRRAAGAGLIRPELAVLLAYAKSDLVEAVETSPLGADPAVAEAVTEYFPPAFLALGADLPPRHRLAAQLGATGVAGELVDQMGIAWTHETAAELGRSVVDVAAAFWAARGVLDAAGSWGLLEAAADDVTADVESAVHHRIAAGVAALARRYLALEVRPDPTARIAADRPVAAAVAAQGGPAQGGSTRADQGEERLPAELASALAVLSGATWVADVGRVASACGLPSGSVVEAFAAIDAEVAPGLIRRLEAVRPSSRWAAWQARALIDDLVAWRSRAVTAALGEPSRPEDVVEAVAAWVARNHRAIGRVDRLIDSLDPERPDVLSVAALVVRALAATA
jgi:glutamate dehydrogenase